MGCIKGFFALGWFALATYFFLFVALGWMLSGNQYLMDTKDFADIFDVCLMILFDVIFGFIPALYIWTKGK